MIEIGTKVRILPNDYTSFLTGCDGIVVRLYTQEIYNGKTKECVDVECDQKYGNWKFLFFIEHVEEVFETALPNGQTRCKCGTITSAGSVCCDCKAVLAVNVR
jgi:hypothetical protein